MITFIKEPNTLQGVLYDQIHYKFIGHTISRSRPKFGFYRDGTIYFIIKEEEESAEKQLIQVNYLWFQVTRSRQNFRRCTADLL